MTRQRASQARAAFARVGTAPVSAPGDDNAIPAADDPDSGNASISATGKTGEIDGGKDGISAIIHDGTAASTSVRSEASGRAGRKAGRPRRRVGRPRGPDRVPLTVRILAANDDRLTAAVRTTGQSPQYIVDAALTAYFDALGIP
jgi:hypothetical protein